MPTAKPDYSPGVNWANPINRGLALSANVLSSRPGVHSLATRTDGTAGSDFGPTRSPFGPTRGTSINGGGAPDTWAVSLDAASLTIEAVVRVWGLYTGNIASIQGVIGTNGGGVAYLRLGDSSGAGKVNIQVGTGGGKFGGYDWTPHFGSFVAVHLVGSGSSALAYVNGTLVASGTAASSAVTTVAINADDTNNRGSPMDYLLLNAWSRPLSPADRWGHLIRPATPSRLLFAPASAPAGFAGWFTGPEQSNAPSLPQLLCL